MLGWVLFTLLVLVVLTVLTLAWWKIGDQWADGEHKRFGPKDVDRQRPRTITPDQPAEPDEPVVIREDR
ncbi:MAG: hypothetical protein RIB60_01370 [Phycisphaerales bacterium]